MLRYLVVGLTLLLAAQLVPANQPADKPLPQKLPMSGLAPARPFPNLCLLRYRISTSSPECQAYFDQGLGYLYSYVWLEAARSFETATHYDPQCAMAWWGLSRGLERWNKKELSVKALEKARDQQPQAAHREQLLITALLQAKGLAQGLTTAEAQKQAAIRTIDELLSLYDDDEEGWFFRGQLASGFATFGGNVSSAPFYKALVRVNPLHPAANHELVHFYEGQRRPALGWIYAENYLKSSPGIPHAFHMQAHLATRLGRWDKTADRSTRAIELQREYHQQQNVRPAEDWQFGHHLEVLLLSLIHDGRFAEARKVKEEAARAGLRQTLNWFRLHLAERSWDDARQAIDELRPSDKNTVSYLTALCYLKQDRPDLAAAAVDALRQSLRTGKTNRQLENRLWETQGQLLCQQGEVKAGLSVLAKIVERTKDDYSHHAWGNGAYYMESWGSAALKSGQDEIAEEAFLEALAHDPGSARGALGLHVLCERQGRAGEASRYRELARRSWHKADPGVLDRELAYLREPYPVYGGQAAAQ